MSWEADLDRWLTIPPEPRQRKVAVCPTCGAEIYEGDEVLIDRLDGDYYCDESCYLAYMRKAGYIETDTAEIGGDSA